jgi:hypothetical protein
MEKCQQKIQAILGFKVMVNTSYFGVKAHKSYRTHQILAKVAMLMIITMLQLNQFLKDCGYNLKPKCSLKI